MKDCPHIGLPSVETLERWLERLVSFGPRLTGWSGHREYISFLKAELSACGYEIHSDHYKFTRWEPLEWGVSLIGGDGVYLDERLPGIFYHPYSGSTGQNGIEAGLVHCPRGNFRAAAGKIALVDVRVPCLPARLLISPRAAYPKEEALPRRIRHPVIGSILPGLNLDEAKKCGVLGVIGIWRGLEDAQTENQYLPFTTPLANCPALWAGGASGDLLKQHAAKNGKVRLTLRAETTANARTESFYAVLPGNCRTENILLTTHTDGPNACEENGGLALLALARHFAASPLRERRRNLVFLFVTGHFQLPQFANGAEHGPRRGSGPWARHGPRHGAAQATAPWLKAHPELWDGKAGHQRAVAGITLEHLGAMEWKAADAGQHSSPTGEMEAEYVYASNKTMSDVYLDSVKSRSRARGFTLHPSRFLYFGEGGVLYSAGIPTISMIPMPAWLCAVEDQSNPLPGRVDARLMLDQINGFITVISRLDSMTAAEIGRNDRGLWLNIPAALSALPELFKTCFRL